MNHNPNPWISIWEEPVTPQGRGRWRTWAVVVAVFLGVGWFWWMASFR